MSNLKGSLPNFSCSAAQPATAPGTVTESQPNWIVTPLEPGALTTVTATALKAQSAECRLRLISR